MQQPDNERLEVQLRPEELLFEIKGMRKCADVRLGRTKRGGMSASEEQL